MQDSAGGVFTKWWKEQNIPLRPPAAAPGRVPARHVLGLFREPKGKP